MVYPAQVATQSKGDLQVNAVSFADGKAIPDASVRITSTGNPEQVIDEQQTNISGKTDVIELDAPALEYSMEPSANQPYSEYNVSISAPGYETLVVNAIEILPGEKAIQNARLNPIVSESTAELFVIPPHTLFGEYPPKIIESEVKTVEETGEIVLSEVVIPEYVVVHDGPPSDRNADNYYVLYKDYIKNVASSEIYATWPEATILANVLAIQSFTLNRVYTEWYRNKGYQFTITSSTATDHKWIPERNIFESISDAVDNVFNNFLSRPNIAQPILTQYCDGKRTTCPGLMSQWGSKFLGDEGYTAIEILKNFYGSSIYINETDIVSGVPVSWPGYDLMNGSRGEAVSQIQRQLNEIATAYPLIPTIAVDGIYGVNTTNAVKVFQRIFDLDETGITDFPTWFKISEIYVAVSRIAEYVR